MQADQEFTVAAISSQVPGPFMGNATKQYAVHRKKKQVLAFYIEAYVFTNICTRVHMMNRYIDVCSNRLKHSNNRGTGSEFA